jgi:MFS family permease
MAEAQPDPDVRRHRRRAVLASTVGTAIEWYDFFLYGTAAALVFPAVFFPGTSHLAGVLAAFGSQFVGFAARPLGAALFGHYGDRIGRKATLVTTLVLMGASTFAMGLLPGYAALGVAAPVLLVTLRVLQGIGVGGEWGGSVLLSMEWGPPGRRGLMASWPQLGVPLGLLGSTGLTAVMSAVSGPHFETWGWRVPFLASIVLVGIGLYVRLRVLESPEFAEVRSREGVEHRPVWTVIREQHREILAAAFMRMSQQAPFYLYITFLLTYGTEHLGVPRGRLLGYTLAAATMGLVTVPLFGHLSDVLGRRLVYGTGVVATALFAFPYFGLLNTRDTGLMLLAVLVAMFFHDMQYGPLAALTAESFGPRVRYSGAGLGYHLGSVVAGGPAPLIAAALLARTGSSAAISAYMVGCALVSLVALLLMPRRGAPASTSERAPARTGVGREDR